MQPTSSISVGRLALSGCERINILVKSAANGATAGTTFEIHRNSYQFVALALLMDFCGKGASSSCMGIGSKPVFCSLWC